MLGSCEYQFRQFSWPPRILDRVGMDVVAWQSSRPPFHPAGAEAISFVRNLPPMRSAIRHSRPAQPLCGLPTVQVHGGSTCRLMTLVAPRACTNKAEGRMYLSSRRGVKRVGIVGAG